MKKRKHMYIPDTQVKPGVPTDHIRAAARYAVDKKPDVIVMIGDWWDMPSLSSYEKKGSKYFHDKSYRADIHSGNIAMAEFMNIINTEIERLKHNKKKQWKPELHFFMGNHEDRINRALWQDPVLEGTIGLGDLLLDEWIVHPFREPVLIDGVAYCHFFQNPASLIGSVIGGTIENKLTKLGHSFTMGHQQTLQYGVRYDGLGRKQQGLVAGAFYMHDEDYMGPQKNKQHWRGIIVKHEVCDGEYDPMFVSLDFLLRRYGD